MRFNNSQGFRDFRASIESKAPAMDSIAKFNKTPGDQLTEQSGFDKEMPKVAASSGEDSIVSTTNPSVNIDRSKMHSDNMINVMNIRKNNPDRYNKNMKSMPPLNAIINQALKTLRGGVD